VTPQELVTLRLPDGFVVHVPPEEAEHHPDAVRIDAANLTRIPPGARR
jgi:hypothetical protein